MAVTIYGIKTCDTVRKARAFLDVEGIPYRFHDFRVDGLEAGMLDHWIDALGWEKLLNRASTSFRALPEERKTILDARAAAALMLAEPTMIKRPVLDADGRLTVGFKQDQWRGMLGQ
jgi:arsenate reductase